MFSKFSIEDLEKVIKQTKETVHAITNFYQRELDCYHVLALAHPKEFEEKRSDCQTKLSLFNQKVNSLPMGELEEQLAELQSKEASLKDLETQADNAAKVLMIENNELEKWCNYFSSQPKATWNTQLPPRLAVQEQRKSLERLHKGYSLHDKQLNCLNILALSKEPQLVNLAQVFNLFHDANLKGGLPLRMPIPFRSKISNIPKLKELIYDSEVSLKDLLSWGRQHRQNLLDRLTLDYASNFYRQANQQLESLPSDEKTDLSDKLSQAYSNMKESILSTSRGSDYCSDDCYHPYRNYGIESFVPTIQTIDTMHAQELSTARDVYGLFATTKTVDLDMVSVPQNVVDLIMAYRK